MSISACKLCRYACLPFLFAGTAAAGHAQSSPTTIGIFDTKGTRVGTLLAPGNATREYNGKAYGFSFQTDKITVGAVFGYTGYNCSGTKYLLQEGYFNQPAPVPTIPGLWFDGTDMVTAGKQSTAALLSVFYPFYNPGCQNLPDGAVNFIVYKPIVIDDTNHGWAPPFTLEPDKKPTGALGVYDSKNTFIGTVTANASELLRQYGNSPYFLSFSLQGLNDDIEYGFASANCSGTAYLLDYNGADAIPLFAAFDGVNIWTRGEAVTFNMVSFSYAGTCYAEQLSQSTGYVPVLLDKTSHGFAPPFTVSPSAPALTVSTR